MNVVMDIRRHTGKDRSAEEKIRRSLMAGSGEDSIAKYCRREANYDYKKFVGWYQWSMALSRTVDVGLPGDLAHAANGWFGEAAPRRRPRRRTAAEGR